jgi:hypothetical protein
MPTGAPFSLDLIVKSPNGENAALTFDVLSEEDSKPLNRQLLATSGLRVVLVCRKRVEKFLQELDLEKFSSAHTTSIGWKTPNRHLVTNLRQDPSINYSSRHSSGLPTARLPFPDN